MVGEQFDGPDAALAKERSQGRQVLRDVRHPWDDGQAGDELRRTAAGETPEILQDEAIVLTGERAMPLRV